MTGEGILTPELGSVRTRREPGAQDRQRGKGIQTRESGSVRRGREPGAKEKERVNGSRLQSLDLSEEGVSQEPKKRKE